MIIQHKRMINAIPSIKKENKFFATLKHASHQSQFSYMKNVRKQFLPYFLFAEKHFVNGRQIYQRWYFSWNLMRLAKNLSITCSIIFQSTLLSRNVSSFKWLRKLLKSKYSSEYIWIIYANLKCTSLCLCHILC